MGVMFTKSGKYNSEKMESKDAKKHSNMSCFNSRSDSISPYEDADKKNEVQKKRFSLNRFKRRCKKTDEEDSLENLREEFDRVNRIRYDLESNKPIKLEESVGNCEGLVCLHNSSVLIMEGNILEEEGKSKSVDYIHEKMKNDDSLSFLSVKSEIITASRRSSVECNSEVINHQEEVPLQLENTENQSITDTGNEMDPTPPNSPQDTIEDITYGTVLGEQNITALKLKIQKEIDRKTTTIAESDEEGEENSMWKKPIQVGNTFRVVTDMKKEINTIAMEAVTIHIQIENFKGTKTDQEFAYIRRKLIQHLESLGNMKLLIHDKADAVAINEIESNIKRSIADLEVKASENQKNIKGHLVKTHSSNTLPVDYEKSELLKAENFLQQVKQEVGDLETNFESHTNSENLSTVNNLEQRIVSIYKDLETIEDSESHDLKKMKDDLYRDLFRCSGKLKKARRRSSVTPPEELKSLKEVDDIRSIDAHLKSVEEANRNSLEDLNTRINTLTRQISQTFTADRKGSQVAAKIKVEAFKLAWESLKQHLYSDSVGVEIMMEIVDELDDLTRDVQLNNKQFKKYVRSHRGDWGSQDSPEKKKLKDIVEELKIVKRMIGCFQGYYKDENYVRLESKISRLSDLLKGVNGGGDMKLDLAKAKIQLKIMEYLEILDEKSIKI